MLYSVVFMEKWCAKAQHRGQIPFVSIVLKLHRRSPLWIHSCGEMFRLIMGINVTVIWGL